jgi:hypothetical protein
MMITTEREELVRAIPINRRKFVRLNSSCSNLAPITVMIAASVKSLCSKLVIVAWVIAAIIVWNPTAFAGTVNIKGSGSYTAVTVSFSFDGTGHPANPSGSAVQELLTGNDNIGGPFTGENIGEYAVDFATSCEAPDGTAGVSLELVQAIGAVTYNQGQLYFFGVGPGSGCVSLSTGIFVLTETHTVFGGTGKFANASGSITVTQTGKALSQPASPGSGLFTAASITEAGSVND